MVPKVCHYFSIVQVQFLKTTGPYGKMLKDAPDMPDPLPRVKEQLIAALDASDDSAKLTLRFPVFMILAKHPKPL
jgi:hypothetical protein